MRVRRGLICILRERMISFKMGDSFALSVSCVNHTILHMKKAPWTTIILISKDMTRSSSFTNVVRHLGEKSTATFSLRRFTFSVMFLSFAIKACYRNTSQLINLYRNNQCRDIHDTFFIPPCVTNRNYFFTYNYTYAYMSIIRPDKYLVTSWNYKKI